MTAQIFKTITCCSVAAALALPSGAWAASCDKTGNWRITNDTLPVTVRAKATGGTWKVDSISFNGTLQTADQKLTGKFQKILSKNVPRKQTTVISLRFSSAEGYTTHCSLELIRRAASKSNNQEVKAKASTCEGDVHYQCDRQFKASSSYTKMQYEVTLTNRKLN
jgi:hypothetical protein